MDLLQVGTEREGNEVTLEIEVSPQEVVTAVNKAYRELSNRAKIPGFRKGKVPRPILVRHLGPDAVREFAVQEIATPAYREALTRSGVEPVTEAELDVVEFDEAGTFKFKATAAVRPEPVLGEYKELEVERLLAEVSDDRIEAQITDLREQLSEVKPAEGRGVETGDIVQVELRVYVDGKKPEGVEPQETRIVIGNNRLVPPIDERILGATVDEVRQFPVHYPDDFRERQLAGLDAELRVKILQIETRVVPELDDAFVQRVDGESHTGYLRLTDIKDAAALLKKLRAEDNPLAAYLFDQCSEDVRSAAAELGDGDTVSEEIKRDVTRDLNYLLQDDELYSEERFAGLELSDELRSQVDQELSGDAQVACNRSLLELAYPEEIAASTHLVTVADLRLDLRRRMEEAEARAADDRVREAVVEKAVATSSVDIPSAMIEDEIDFEVHQFAEGLGRRRISLDTYFQMTGRSMEDLRAQLSDSAAATVKRELVLEAIAKAEELTVDPELVHGQLHEMGAVERLSEDQIHAMLADPLIVRRIERRLLRSEAVRFLVDSARVSERTVTPEEAEKLLCSTGEEDQTETESEAAAEDDSVIITP